MDVCLTESLKRAIDGRNVAAARSAILTEIRDDRWRDEPIALSLADAVNEELPGFYEADNGLYSDPSGSPISEDLWTKARSEMMLNFSRERLCSIDTMVRSLRLRGNARSDGRRNTHAGSGRRNSRSSWPMVVVFAVVALIPILIFSRKGQAPVTPAGVDDFRRAVASPQRPGEYSCPTNDSESVSTNDLPVTDASKEMP